MKLEEIAALRAASLIEAEPGEDGQETNAEIDLTTVPDPSSAPAAPENIVIDPTIVGKYVDDEYVKNYKHDPGSPIFPTKIMAMNRHQLSDLGRRVKAKMQSREVDRQVGLYADGEYVFYQRLLSFIRSLIAEKS